MLHLLTLSDTIKSSQKAKITMFSFQDHLRAQLCAVIGLTDIPKSYCMFNSPQEGEFFRLQDIDEGLLQLRLLKYKQDISGLEKGLCGVLKQVCCY